MPVTYNTRPLPFLRAEVLEIETFVEIKNICGEIETSVQRNPAKKATACVIFRCVQQSGLVSL